MLADVQRVGSAMLDDYPEACESLVRRWIGSMARFAGA